MKPLLLLLALLGGAQAASVYRGTLGRQPVVLRLNGPDDSRYFYLQRGLDISLEVAESGGRMTLTERLASWDAGPDGSYTVVTGTFDLTRSVAGLSGTWSSPDGTRTLPVRLVPVNVAAERLALPDSPQLARWRRQDAYTFLKFNHALRPAGREAGLNWWREPLSGLKYPQLPVGTVGAAVLQDRLLSSASDALDCQSAVGAKADTQPAWAQDTTLTYRSARLLSLQDDVSAFCGGAHPDAFTNGLILDLHSGRTLTAHDLWPRLSSAELNRRYQAAYPNDSGDDECRQAVQDQSVTDPGDYSAWLTPAGLTLWPAFLPHVVLACAENVTLPYAGLSPLAGPLAPRR